FRQLFGNGIPEVHHPVGQGHMLEVTTSALAEIPQQYLAALCGVEGFAFTTSTERQATAIVGRNADAKQARILVQLSIFSLAMAAIRSEFDTHSLARSGFLDWSREPSG